MLKVFVYGTLKPGEANYQRYCAFQVVDAKKAYTFGKLFALPMGYPAMTLGDSLVYGYLLTFVDSKVLNNLDILEDYQPSRQMSQNLYNRQEVEIYDLEGRSLGMSWVYLMTPNQVSQLKGSRQQRDGWWSGCGLTVEHSLSLHQERN
ncbi:gamma-glutamylcyclotransferase [Scytonema hofmannii FACHB-248]|uniref:Gamma-glutamylcyclotransferase n=1 Tax=Scytonema hofmannii FACHB-248 TaxID=1842502 RepID=A0ABR8GQH4_9CYAN|nr:MULTISPECIES: gamma-glutamylcyclotransferase [Nostocales]MBD2605444.1 gamma-glutamylcyclotransferase [Scytonema hofmannii FACHB-248]